jgi:hypothetical protein
MDPHPDRQADSLLLGQTAIEDVYRLNNAEPGPDASLCIIVMGLRVAKVDEQSVTKILGDLARKALDNLRTGGLVGVDHRQEIFRVELAGECRRVHEVADHDRNLAAFGFWGSQRRWGDVLRWRWHVLTGWRRGRRARSLVPHQDAPLLVNGQPLSVDEFGFEVGEVGVIEAKLALQGPVGDAALVLEDCQHLREHLIKGHGLALPFYTAGLCRSV